MPAAMTNSTRYGARRVSRQSTSAFVATNTSATIGISDSKCWPARRAMTLVENSAAAIAPMRQS